MLDLQTYKIIDVVVEKKIMTPWLCHGLSYDYQIWHKDSFRKAQVSAKLHCPTSTVTLFSEDGQGRIHSSPVIEIQ